MDQTYSLESFLNHVQKRDPNQTEFAQAVREVMTTLWPFLEQNPKYRQMSLLERLVEPERVIQFRVVWVDDRNQVQVNRAWRVQFSSAIGPYKGGMRFHPSVNLSILKFLGFEQTFKNALTTLPMGGGKGGSDFDPKGKSDNEIRRFCYAFMRELTPYIGADIDVPAGDIGVGGREISYMFAMYKNLTREFSGVLTGKTVGQGGSLIRTEATGFGLVYFLQNMLAHCQDTLVGKTVLVSGAGNVSLHTAQKCIELGAKVVTLSDSKGTLHLADGFTLEQIEALKTLKAQGKRLSDFAEQCDAKWLADTRPWHIKADIALPCATQNEINAADAKQLIANGIKHVAEGANMPSDADAITLFQQNGIIYAPGKASNAGGVAVSGLEMSQNSVRQYASFATLDEQLKTIMKNIHDACATYGKQDNGCIDYKKGANIAGFSQIANAMVNYGIL